jgi:phosphoglycolate phosphatase-like HAD superfamily hydrolase
MKLFVWDFHGVMEKNNELAVIDISNKVLLEFGFRDVSFSKENSEHLYGLKWYEYFEYLLPELPHKKHLEMQKRCFEISNQDTDIIRRYIKPNDHLHSVVYKISRKHSQLIISNTPPKSLEIFLNLVKIEKYFQNGNAMAVDAHKKNVVTTKKEVLLRYIEALKDEPERCIFIGDSPTDIELAQFLGKEIDTRTYLYAHPGKKHRHCEADYYINDLREIVREI